LTVGGFCETVAAPGRSLHHLMESVSGPASDGVAARKETAVR
jgi:hypothetical protein